MSTRVYEDHDASLTTGPRRAAGWRPAALIRLPCVFPLATAHYDPSTQVQSSLFQPPPPPPPGAPERGADGPVGRATGGG